VADGKWVMTEEDSRRVDLTSGGSAGQDLRSLPNYGQHRAVDDREGGAEEKCAFCGSSDIQSGFGSFGEGFGCRSFICRVCGGTTDLVYRDVNGRFF